MKRFKRELSNVYYMNIVDREGLQSLRNRAKNIYNAKKLDYSDRDNKKYVVTLNNGKKIHFGDNRYEDFLIHKDWNKRLNYIKRASKIRDKQGNLTYKNPESANFWVYHLLW